MTERREHWLSMANDDLAFAELGLSNGFFSQVCFLSQQASEKALKAVLLSRTGGYPRVHSIVDLVKRNAYRWHSLCGSSAARSLPAW